MGLCFRCCCFLFFFLLFVFWDELLTEVDADEFDVLFVDAEADDENSSNEESVVGDNIIVKKQLRKWLIENDKRCIGTDCKYVRNTCLALRQIISVTTIS